MTELHDDLAKYLREQHQTIGNSEHGTMVPIPVALLEQAVAETSRVADAIERLDRTPVYDAHDEVEDMCTKCVTPWKCNGPHEPPYREPDGYLVDKQKVLDIVLGRAV